jgi:hypothetical protein
MLPLQQAYEVKQSYVEYLKDTFSYKEKVVTDISLNKGESVGNYKVSWANFDTIFKD